MSNSIKTRNLKKESRYLLFSNFVTFIITATLLWFVLPVIVPITNKMGIRNTLFLNYICGFISFCFMFLLEKYSVVISGLYEKNLINTLSVIYTFVIMCIINAILFMSFERFIFDATLSFVNLAALIVFDIIYEIHIKNPKKFKKPKLLILASDEKNFFRMKRVKYGTLNAYDSWYENIDSLSAEELVDFIDNNLDNYDALCILDGLNDFEYNLAVKTAVEMNKDLYIVPNMIDVGKTNSKIVRLDDVLTLYMPKNYVSKFSFFVKRIVDILLSGFGVIVAFIPMVFIALAIKLTSPGPIFYKQERLTKNKKPFYIYKFRTMVPDAEKLTGPKFAEKDDPRITKIGKILRSCRLDELPQLFNILKGDMTLVGPRPERPVFVEEFGKEIENYDYRFAVKAGLTSLSHVYGRYSTYIHDRTYYDLFYITNYSLLLDLRIILLTTKTMLMKSAAEGEDDFKQKTVSSLNKEVQLSEKN